MYKFTILLYHGVSALCVDSPIRNFQGKHIAESNFRLQMETIRKSNLNVISMQDYYLGEYDKDRDAVAITFDDGFENNYTVAAPILDELNLPATFYISTGFISTDKMFWTDIIEDCVVGSQKRNLKFSVLGNLFDIKIGGDKEKKNAILGAKRFCKSATSKTKDEFISQLIKCSGVTPSNENDHNYKKMTWPQVRELNQSSLFDVGGHSHNHEILAALDQVDLEYEVSTSINMLINNLGEYSGHYSYPEGQENHFNSDVIDLLLRYGTNICPSAIEGTNTLYDNPFYLKRIMVGFDSIAFPFSL